MNAADALTGLITLVGTGGLTSIVIGFLAYKKEAGKGRREPMKAETLPTPGPYPGSWDMELVANALTTVSSAVMRLSLLHEFQMTRRPGGQEAFEKWIEEREMHATLEAFRADQRSRAKASK